MTQAIREELIEELLQGYSSPKDLLGEAAVQGAEEAPAGACPGRRTDGASRLREG